MAAAGLSGRQTARLLGQDETRVSRWLTGRIPISEVDVAAFLAVCGIVTRSHEPVLRLVRERDTSAVLRLSGDDAYRDHIGPAERITEFACLEVPWLLRTRDYTQAIAQHSRQADLWATVHQQAVGLLTLLRPPLVTVLMNEWVLRTPTGGPAVMAAQVDHVLRLSEWRRISVRVLPISAGAPASGLVPFGMAQFAEHRPVLYRHDPNGLVLWDDPAEVSAYRTALEKLDGAALNEQQSLSLIRQLATEPHRPSSHADYTGGGGLAMMTR
jgi:hypothetical protein